MRRKCTEHLLTWKKSPDRKPLVLTGGRQTGKTWLLRDFGEKNYTDSIYINFETDAIAAEFLSTPREPEEALLFLETFAGKPIRQDSTLLILDNLQCIPDGPRLLSGIGLDFPGCHVAAIEKGPVFGKTSHDIGDTFRLSLPPMDFEEFLWANKEFSLSKEIRSHFTRMEPMGKALHQKADSQFRLYMAIGGMPGAICEYRREKKLLMVPDIQKKIHSLLLADISTDSPKGLSRYARNCFLSIPGQLYDSNRKFQYCQVTKGSTATLLKPSLDWLISSGYALLSPRKIYKAEEPDPAFRLYLPDTGLTACSMGIPPYLILSGHETPALTGVAESFLAQSFFQNGYSLSHWYSRNQALVPFLLEKNGCVTAVDYRLNPQEKKRSLSRLGSCQTPDRMYLISTEDFHRKEHYDVIPFYAAFCI